MLVILALGAGRASAYDLAAGEILDGVCFDGCDWVRTVRHSGTHLGVGSSRHSSTEVAADLGDRGRCERLLAELEPEAGLQVLLGAHLILGCASRPLGMLARALGRFDEAERHFEVALAADTRMGARPWVAETQLAYAALLLERGGSEDRRRAEALLDQACATAAELGMAAVTRRAEMLRR